MIRKADIEALLQRAETTLQRINSEYENSLQSKTVSADLRIDIKDYFGNLRSTLDYIAKDIVDKYCPLAKLNKKMYFPIFAEQKAFETEMPRSYPDLITNRKRVYDYLESIQPFKSEENKWLSHFNKLNNINKHDCLVPQKRIEIKRVNVNIHGGGSVNWNSSAVTFGPGVSIGGVPVNPNTQLPTPSNTQSVSIESWVDFQFEDIKVSALWLTKESFDQINRIYNDLKSEI
jgi:hypothetical protein